MIHHRQGDNYHQDGSDRQIDDGSDHHDGEGSDHQDANGDEDSDDQLDDNDDGDNDCDEGDGAMIISVQVGAVAYIGHWGRKVDGMGFAICWEPREGSARAGVDAGLTLLEDAGATEAVDDDLTNESNLVCVIYKEASITLVIHI